MTTREVPIKKHRITQNPLSLVFLSLFLVFCQAIPVWAESFERAVSDSVLAMLVELKQKELLQGKRVAVFGFVDANTKQECSALSSMLADRFHAEIQRFLPLLELSYVRVVPKNKANLWITGSWHKGHGSFNLTVQALEVRRHKRESHYSTVKKIDKQGLSSQILDCVNPGDHAPGPPPNVRVLQEKIADFNNKIEQLRKRKKYAGIEKDMLSIIERQKQTIKALKKQAGSRGTVTYTDRIYPHNLAFLNIFTQPSGLDIYVDGQWVGTSPIRKYEIEAGQEHVITAKGDPRYLKSASIKRTYKRFKRVVERLKPSRGSGQILLLGDRLIQSVMRR